MFSFVFCLGQFCTFSWQFGNIWLHFVPENGHHDVLDHVTKIFLRDESLAQWFLLCNTGQREQEFRAYAAMHLRSGCCAWVLNGSTVVAACLLNSQTATRGQI
jgi:hypothetical protein